MAPEEPTEFELSAPSSLEDNRQAAAINHLLGEIGLTTTDQTTWWNLVAQPDLGDRTATQAVLDGDVDKVRALIERWYERSKVAADHVSSSPEFLELLRKKLAELDKGPLGNNPIRRTA